MLGSRSSVYTEVRSLRRFSRREAVSSSDYYDSFRRELYPPEEPTNEVIQMVNDLSSGGNDVAAVLPVGRKRSAGSETES